ncbi:hypothetical protein E2R51_13425 [Jeotgalibacillus sp. S-D1]|uniref:hypothetical protein n=1 Tax=Jeotgalibacillus sp. S-D1 TaxID=2552189 RepID=UPI001059C926|nr:hypothetical protein [Jeotgalibacillus sp. S-D1]TDL31364.1 hypothetical protein E2R51_13425 [Jeotgalibacillus sp. S-D1]
MNPVILICIYIVILSISIVYVFQKRKKSKGERDIKSFITPISFFVISILAFFSALTGKGGIGIWLSVTALLLIGAFFTKYLPLSSEKSS